MDNSGSKDAKNEKPTAAAFPERWAKAVRARRCGLRRSDLERVELGGTGDGHKLNRDQAVVDSYGNRHIVGFVRRTCIRERENIKVRQERNAVNHNVKRALPCCREIELRELEHNGE